MSRMSDIYTAAKNISQKAPKSVGTNVIQRTVKKYPRTAKALDTIAKMALGGTVIGVGGKILNE